MKVIRKVLIANRGEIAVRIIKTLDRLGVDSVAIFSDPDRGSPHVMMASEAYSLKGTSSTETYLDIDKIIDIARRAKVDAIHPGYGFLSENAVFAERVEAAGMVFIGPPAAAIRTMGDKLEARAMAQANGVPIVEGTLQPLRDSGEARQKADEMGYPVLLKAAAGGGGKGMRVVWDSSSFDEQFERARSEARNAFGNDAIYIEKYIERPRHIEIQIAADAHGHIVHLFERECSIQRRHQKVVEETPANNLRPEVLQAMAQAAMTIARACNYRNAGTVEFLVDDQQRFYFLEMNTRLQVEHPVTEMITGIDLVELQLHIAEGKPLPLRQEEIQRNGHAIELRVYAEDPRQNFMPSTGVLSKYREPTGAGIRVDSGVMAGMEIPVWYDPLLAKLIAWGQTRAQAIERMKRAISNYVIEGVATTLPFGAQVMLHPDFVDGNYATDFVDRLSPSMLSEEERQMLGKTALRIYMDAIQRLQLAKTDSQ